MQRKRRPTRLFLFSLIVTQVLLLLSSAWLTGPGWDEWGHLPSGLFSLQYGDFHPYRVNPPLVRLLAAIPVAILGGGIDFETLPKAPGFRSEGFLGMAYVHQHGPDVFRWISIGRTAVIPIAVFGTLLLFKIGRHFGGHRVAFFVAILWVFSPTVLAYGGTITPDIAAAVFGLWAVWCFYCWYRIGKTRETVWLGISVAMAVLSKSTWIILPPLLFIMFVVLRICLRSRLTLKVQSKRVALAALLALVLIHAAYDFRGMLRPLGSFSFVSQSLSGFDNSSIGVAPNPGNRFVGSPVAWLPVPLPAEYVQGIDVQKRDFELTDMRSYLMGTWGARGWWYYYGVAWLVKEPLAFWCILGIGWASLFWRNKRRSSTKRVAAAVLAVPGLLVLLFVSSQTGFNHHLRYVLPAFPAAFLIAALPIRHVNTRVQKILFMLLAWFSISSVVMVPRFYAYFSEAVGGWQNGHLYLNASNLDWGQDLLAIRHWSHDHPEKRPIHLLYSPSQLDFSRLGIDATIAEGQVLSTGPRLDGWWVVSIDRLLTEPNSWFLEQTPTERISVSTTVYHIVDGKVVSFVPRQSSVPRQREQ
jgi:4-amino-4-deoxy-L-arabinose transferase-like glycosyltransferase